MSELNLSTDETRVSYGIGRQLGGQLRDNPPPGASLDAIIAGITDAFAGQPSRVSEAELTASFKVIRDIMQA
ncbi:MAG: FKBP-type peptidyl-prolyl cis-trans isomerase N-terminal domain-containing protein, partial [Pseudomonadales bacterium]